MRSVCVYVWCNPPVSRELLRWKCLWRYRSYTGRCRYLWQVRCNLKSELLRKRKARSIVKYKQRRCRKSRVVHTSAFAAPASSFLPLPAGDPAIAWGSYFVIAQESLSNESASLLASSATSFRAHGGWVTWTVRVAGKTKTAVIFVCCWSLSTNRTITSLEQTDVLVL